MIKRTLLAIFLALLVLAVACGDSGQPPTRRAAPGPSPSPSPTLGPAPPPVELARPATVAQPSGQPVPTTSIRPFSGPGKRPDGWFKGPFRVALSVSPFDQLSVNAGTFSDGKRTARNVVELEQMFIAHGGNEIFSRATTERNHSIGIDQSLSATLARARMARSMQMPFNPEFQLNGLYGDLTCQPAANFTSYPSISNPGPWHTLTINQMVGVMREYGAFVAREIRATGVEVNMWDVGNEVDFGVAGVAPRPYTGTCEEYTYQPPDNVDPAIKEESVDSLILKGEAYQIQWLTQHVWPHEARLLSAFADGVRSVFPEARFSTHIAISGSATFAIAFWDAMRGNGYVVDEMGFSYYPTASSANSLERFQNTVTALRRAHGKKIFIAEYSFAAAEMGPEAGFFSEWDQPQPGYPISEKGQADFLRDLTAWGVRNGISGIRPWAPEFYDGLWGPMSLFRKNAAGNAEARPAIDAMLEGLQAKQ